MLRRRHCWTLALACALVFASSLTASAARLSYSSQTYRATFARVNFAGAGVGTIECAMTLEGSLHTRTITKTTGLLMGLMTRATVGVCARGSATVNTATLPWHDTYGSFVGTLPNITRINQTVVGGQIT